MTREQKASGWLASVQGRAVTGVKAEAVAEGTQFSDRDLELVEIGILAAPARCSP